MSGINHNFNIRKKKKSIKFCLELEWRQKAKKIFLVLMKSCNVQCFDENYHRFGHSSEISEYPLGPFRSLEHQLKKVKFQIFFSSLNSTKSVFSLVWWLQIEHLFLFRELFIFALWMKSKNQETLTIVSFRNKSI